MKKPSLVFVAGIFLTVVCFTLYMMEHRLPFLGSLSLGAYDEFVRQVQEDPKAGAVTLVDIDERSLQAVGQWPWPRYLIAELTARLLNMGASVIGFDIVFAERDGKSPAVVVEDLNASYGLDARITGVPDELMDYDKVFSRLLKSAGDRVILGCVVHLTDDPVTSAPDIDLGKRSVYNLRGGAGTVGVDGLRFMAAGRDVSVAIPVLTQSAGNSAFFNAMPDADSIIRRVPLVVQYQSRLIPSLALEAVRMYRGTAQGVVNYDIAGVTHVRLDDLVIPTDGGGQLLINYRKLIADEERGGFRSFPSYSAVDILAGTVSLSAISNKIVFIGTSAQGLRDIRATPLTPEFSGVEVHATIVDNILAGDMLAQPGWMRTIDVGAIAILGLFLTVLIDKGRALLSFLITAAALLLTIVLSYQLFVRYQVVFVPIRLVLATIIIYPVLTTLRYLHEERQRKQVREMFGTMVSRDVLQFLEKNPESFSLTGQRREATILFADVAAFTTISESLEPAKLSELLNRYLTPMTQIIMNRNGYVDKYEGDSIMAEWGVPNPMDDHAVQGCLAALEQTEKLDELRPVLKQQFGHDMYARVGLNSGPVTAGNMGSERKFQYTVMGDSVNLARRLEPVNKDYGTTIIIGQSTREMAGEAIEARLLDKLIVKGKTEPVEVFELLGRKGSVDKQCLQVAELYEEALRLHWERKWDDSLAALAEALRVDAGDLPSMQLRERIAGYKANAPGPHWVGERVRLDKE